jgi:hypothetical protein
MYSSCSFLRRAIQYCTSLPVSLGVTEEVIDEVFLVIIIVLL